jgi:hypothetical protein
VLWRWVAGWMIGGGSCPGGGLGFFLFAAGSWPTQSPIQRVPGALSPGVKRPERETGHSPISNAQVKCCMVLYLYSSNTPSWRGAQLKHRDLGSHNGFCNSFTFIVGHDLCSS